MSKTMNDPQRPYPYERPNSVASPAEANPPVSNLLADIRKPVPNHRHGRVARLPKATRDKLNEMILDGFAYKEIIQALAQEAKSLNEDALTKWRHGGGYQEWLDEQQDREDIQLKEEYAWEYMERNPGTTLNQATLKMVTSQIRQTLRAAGSTALQKALEDSPEIYVRILNALTRITTAAITCEHDRLKEVARREELEKQQQGPDSRSVSEKTIQRAEQVLNLR